MSHSIIKVISGGQTGADQAGWRAAKALGIPTGGTCPAGFRTEGRRGPDGRLGPDEDHPEFADLYGATAHHSRDYPPRTRINVENADLTLIFNPGPNWSAGTKAAVKAARSLRRRFVVVELAGFAIDTIVEVDGVRLTPPAAFDVVSLQRDHDHPFTGLKTRPVVSTDAAITVLRVFLTACEVRTLNVAGSRESNHPGIGAWVEAFLLQLLSLDQTLNESGVDAVAPQPAHFK